MSDTDVQEPTRALATLDADGLLPDRATVRHQLQTVREFQATVRELFIQGHDFGVIPGTGAKPTLLKPGAEKLAKLLGLADEYEIVSSVEDWDRPLFRYLIRCRLVRMDSGATVSQGLGECNSMESRYRWRWAWAGDLSKEQRDLLRAIPGRARKLNTRRGESEQFRVENDDIYSQVNTLLKMAKKRALVDAALSAGRLSDLFTQDLEDMPHDTPPPAEEGLNDLPPDGPAQQPSAARSAPTGKQPGSATDGPSLEMRNRWNHLWQQAHALKDEGLIRKEQLQALVTDANASAAVFVEHGRALKALIDNALIARAEAQADESVVEA